MPHINYKRGETRTFVYRRNANRRRHSSRRRSTDAGRFTLWKDYHSVYPMGPGSFRCFCCTPGPKVRPYRQVRRIKNSKVRRLR